MGIRRPTALLLGGLALAVPGAGAGDLYRCTDAEGRIVYTDSQATCPGAEGHTPGGSLQTVPSEAAAPTAPRPAPAAPSALVADREARRAMKAHWQNRKRQTEAELARLAERLDSLERFVTACNRGREIIGRDETGLKYQVPCDSIRQEYAEVEAAHREAREYLEGGLQRECRRAGCLPGWIR